MKLLLLLTVIATGLAAQPITELPYSPSLDIRSMDTSVSACTDFYRYSCGNWNKNNPMPADQSSWNVYSKLAFDNERFLWGILEEAAKPSPTRTAAQQKIGDLYHACMDEASIERAGSRPVQPALDAIAQLRDVQDVSRFLNQQHNQGTGTAILWGIDSNQDFADAQNVITFATRGALGLPDRDYYTKTDAKSVEIRDRYMQHMQQMFAMIGDSPDQAKRHAAQVMAIETDLARSMLTRVELRDPHKQFHKMTRAEFKALAPALDWDAYLKSINLGSANVINVTEPAYYQEVQKQLTSRSIEEWQSFLRWNIVHTNASLLSANFVKANFDFYQHYLRGTPEMQPRWRKCVQWVDHNLGEALGQVFVTKTFTPETKARTVAMTKEIEAAMERDLRDLPWMSEPTREQALLKLHSIINKVGYPDKWRDYSSVDIRPDDFAGDMARARRFEYHRELAKIGKPLDRGEWGMTPPTVNAYYDAQMNDINFPAGVLQPPLFDPKLDDAPNYGNTGATIGHELTHGFDDEGRQFDAKGNLKDWWSPKDAEAFQQRVDCVSTQYSGYTIVDDIKINGKLTLGEDVADLGGTLLAYYAWQHATAGQNLKPIDGFSPDQRFFIGMAQWACGDMRPELKREMALTNPHSPEEYRINGVVSNMPQFATAFGCKVGQPMVREQPCRVW